MIKHISFKHGWYYYYRVHLEKLGKLACSSMSDYLNSMFDECPHDYFNVLPRSSSLKFQHGIETVHIKDHEVNKLAEMSHSILGKRYKSAHSQVEVFMLENDDKTLAVEVPLWLMPDEARFYPKLFNTENPLTGHIDILRKEGDKIFIWDYKPKSQKEKYASIQVLFYAYMLSKRTGIPLDNFRCGYFDEKDTFVFKPEEKMFDSLVPL